MAKKQLPPEVLAACMQRGIPPTQVADFRMTDVDVFLDGPTGTIRVEISALPERMLEFLRTQQVQVAKAPESTQKTRGKGVAKKATRKKKKSRSKKRS
jgi:hypothetical protein